MAKQQSGGAKKETPPTRTRQRGNSGATEKKEGNQVFADGVNIFTPHQSAPKFVRGRLIISLDSFFEWCEANPDYIRNSEKYGDQVVFDIKTKKDDEDALYLSVDTYKPE